jgi:hypothetical protein
VVGLAEEERLGADRLGTSGDGRWQPGSAGLVAMAGDGPTRHRWRCRVRSGGM